MRRVFVASLLGICAFSVQAGGIGDLFGAFAGRFDSYGSGHDGQAKQLDDVLVRVSQAMNKRMPEVIDAETRLDRVSAEPGLHFSYHYTLTASSSTAIDKASFSSTIRAQLKGKLCDSAQIRSFFNHGVTVGYLYQGNDGLPVGGADFAPDSCDGVKEPASKS